MQKYVDIIMCPAADPEIRFNKVIKLIENISSGYPKGFISFENGKFIVSDQMEPIRTTLSTTSVIKTVDKRPVYEDKYIQMWMHEYLDKRIIIYIFKRINIVLSPLQKEMFLHRYMGYLIDTPMTRDELRKKHSIYRLKYDLQMKELKEILFEVLDLDVVDDHGRWMSLSFVNYLREMRTGIENGYIGLHPDWDKI